MKTIWRIGLATVGAAALATVLTAQARQRQEMALLGVRVLSTVQQVLRAFGNPTRITDVQLALTELESNTSREGQSESPFQSPPSEFDNTNETRIVREIVYLYRTKSGSTYLFQFNKDGRVVQISAYGQRPDPRVRTSRRIGLGDPYSKVVLAYGAHDDFAARGNIYVIRYNKLGVAFQFDAKTNRVTGIFVAAGVPTMGMGFTGLGSGSDSQGAGDGLRPPSGNPFGAPPSGGAPRSGGSMSGPAI
jgi:hypothetical protein